MPNGLLFSERIWTLMQMLKESAFCDCVLVTYGKLTEVS